MISRRGSSTSACTAKVQCQQLFPLSEEVRSVLKEMILDEGTEALWMPQLWVKYGIETDRKLSDTFLTWLLQEVRKPC